MKTLGATVCRFRRTEHSESENGIAIGLDPGSYDIKHIIDMQGNTVDSPLWNYTLENNRGCFILVVED